MSWRIVVISKRAKLDFKMNYLVVRGTETKRIHLSEISTLLIESTAVSLTAVLLNECLKQKIKIIFCDEKRNPTAELLPYYGAHDVSKKIKVQINWKDETKRLIWAEIIKDKISRQQQVLRHCIKSDDESLIEYIKQVEIGDITNREGHAAKVYFHKLFGSDFFRDDENHINSALDYGYAIILSAFNREIVNSGYVTQLGIFHDNQFNAFNLGSDLMEPFRPIVDLKVKKMKLEKFEVEEKREVLEILETKLTLNGKEQYLLNAISIFTKSVLDALRKDDLSLLRFFENEL